MGNSVVVGKALFYPHCLSPHVEGSARLYQCVLFFFGSHLYIVDYDTQWDCILSIGIHDVSQGLVPSALIPSMIFQGLILQFSMKIATFFWHIPSSSHIHIPYC